ncbi:MAG: hypothetical protein IJ651_07005 [Bacteroidales bacterium]|nr:hypothetical protein [Bacteroidales bacterium]
MKKSLLFAFSALVAAVSFVACTKETTNTEETITPSNVKEVELSINASGTDTKTYIDGTVVKWASTGEYLYVYELATPTEGDVVTTKKKSSQGTTTDSGATMNFVTSLAEKATGYTNFDYYAFYPADARQSGDTPLNVNIETSGNQTPTATSFDPKADVLIAKPITGEGSQATSLNMQFTRAIAVGKMTITNLPTDENVTEVRFSAIAGASDVVLAGRTSFNLGTAVPVSSYGNNTHSEEIILDYSSLSLKADSSMDVFFTCFPFELATGDSFTVTVKTATYTYTRTVSLSGSQQLTFTAGKASRFSVKMEDAAETVNAQDIPYAILTYDAAVADGLTTSYATKSFTDLVGGKWEYNAYKGTGIQIKNCSTDANKSSYIKLPVFKDNIRKVEINLAAAYSGKSLRFDSSADSIEGSIYNLSLDANTTFTLTSTELGSIKTAYIHAYGAAVNITSIEVYAGEDKSEQLNTPATVSAALSEDGKGGTVPNSITVSWNSVDHADYYIVTLTPTSGDAVSTSVTTTTATIENLEYETTYSISVVAYANNKGLYSASDAGTCSDVDTEEEPAEITYYVKVTDASTLAASDKLIFVYESSGVAMSTTQNTNNRGKESVTITTSGIASNTLPSGVQVVTLEGSSGSWEFNTGSGYLYSPSANNYLRTQETNSDTGKWTITITSGSATINCLGRSDYYLQYNTSGLFSCYKNTQKNFQIFKLKN